MDVLSSYHGLIFQTLHTELSLEWDISCFLYCTY